MGSCIRRSSTMGLGQPRLPWLLDATTKSGVDKTWRVWADQGLPRPLNEVLVAACQVCDVFVCSMWKAGGVFKAIDNDFSTSAVGPRYVRSQALRCCCLVFALCGRCNHFSSGCIEQTNVESQLQRSGLSESARDAAKSHLDSYSSSWQPEHRAQARHSQAQTSKPRMSMI